MFYEMGCLVKSLAGHDKDNIFVIIKDDGEYVSLVDGILRTLKKPKSKNKKHIQLINERDEALHGKLVHGEHVTDEEIKYFIQCYKRRTQS